MVFFQKTKQYLQSNCGATAIEYALVATGISLAIALGVFTFGGELSVLYDSVLAVFTD